ncbi:MAG TPA: DUF4350 domain-containing protein [Thermomicrobiales bacterium]|nr:DUF4350 domain-containing protein [Thermomicrobiales bacterium]
MRLPGRGILIVGGLLVLLALLAVVARSNETSGVEGPALSMHVTVEDGGRALYIWLSELGYDTRPLEYSTFEVSDDVDALFILAPSFDLTEAESADVLDWVADGGTLLLVSEIPTQTFDDLGLNVRSHGVVLDSAIPLQPVFTSSPLEQMTVDATTHFEFPDAAWVPLLGAGDDAREPVAAVLAHGQGRVHVLSSEYALSNAGIGETDNAAYVLHALAGIPRGGTVVFDEYHHGLTEHGTLTQRLVREPWGWAVLWTVAFTFAWLAFSGKRFGKALPPPPSWARRSSGEYVTTLGAMLRRGKHDRWLRQNYVAQVKRALGGRYRIRADQPAREFVAALSARRADAADLAAPLERLEAPQQIDEATTLGLMRDIDAIKRRMGGV